MVLRGLTTQYTQHKAYRALACTRDLSATCRLVTLVQIGKKPQLSRASAHLHRFPDATPIICYRVTPSARSRFDTSISRKVAARCFSIPFQLVIGYDIDKRGLFFNVTKTEAAPGGRRLSCSAFDTFLLKTPETFVSLPPTPEYVYVRIACRGVLSRQGGLFERKQE